ncbi:MAG TPA: hypothetical protein PLH46_04710 [Caldisericia bacterium]|nr:hypothetical protein [Caldisericia bacterium]
METLDSRFHGNDIMKGNVKIEGFSMIDKIEGFSMIDKIKELDSRFRGNDIGGGNDIGDWNNKMEINLNLFFNILNLLLL